MIGWSVQLSEFGITYEPRGPIKSQCLADFTSELQDNLELEAPWILYVDGSSNKGGGGQELFSKGWENSGYNILYVLGSKHYTTKLSMKLS